MLELTLKEVACFRLLNQKLPHKTPQHIKILEFLLKKGTYHTSQEIAQQTQTGERFTNLILKELTHHSLTEKEGCLYRCNGKTIEQIIEYA